MWMPQKRPAWMRYFWYRRTPHDTGWPRLQRNPRAFLYLVAVYGTTGERKKIQDYTVRAIRGAKRLPGGTPVGVGFGVSTPADVKRYVGLGADAVIVGSAFINVIKRSKAGDLEGAVCRFTRDLRRGTKIKE